jgi:predicted  nucleic acid-binding Zn-ribbon protein
MASNKRTIHLGLDYTQFTGGITEVNRKMGILDAEFKLATEQAKNYGTETDQLGLKQEYLTQKIALQNQKVEEAKRAYEAAANSQNASQKEIDNLEKKYLQESTTLEKLNGQLKTNDETITKLDKDTRSFGDEIRGLASTLGINVSPAIEKLASKFDGINASVGNAILGIGAIATAFVKCSKDVAAFADDLLTLSAQTGIATDELQKMQYAADFVDVSVETMTGSMNKLTRTMSSARDGSKDASEAFKKLHIRITDGQGALRDSNDVFYETIDRLGQIKNETERDALAMKIFGKSAQELNPLIKAGSDRLKELGVEAENLGVIMGEEDLEKAEQFNDALDRMGKVADGLKNSLGLALLPVLTSLFEALSKIPVEVLKTIVIIASAVASILLIVKAIKSVTDTGKAITGFFKNFDLAANKTTLIIIGVVAALIALATIIAVIMGKSDDLSKSMAAIGNSTQELTKTVTGAQDNVKKVQNHADGVINYAGGKTWVGEAGPELVTLPQGSNIIPEKDVGQTIINNYYATIDAKSVKEFNDIVRIMNDQRMAERRMAY